VSPEKIEIMAMDPFSASLFIYSIYKWPKSKSVILT
jgi:hypothetical protein